MTEAATSPVKEGDLLAGKYRVEKVLGAGGMGVVVAARHEQLDQRVAIKFVRDEALGNEEAVERFLREARAAVKLKSEHVAKVLDVGTLESGAPYMVMEYLEGSDLAHVLTERGPASAEVAADWVVQACEALAEAHAAGIVHRDIKPQNLFLARTVGGAAKVKVLDFGISKAVPLGSGAGGLTSTRAMLGSPLYMSPEQMRSSREVDPRADVWALGVVIFELLTGRWPYEAESIPELCLKVVSEPPASLAELRPDAPKAIVDIVERCLRREMGERYANAAELASALEPLVPPASRVIVERARMAVGMTSSGSPQAAATVVSPTATTAAAPRSATLGSARVPARTAPTPAAWGAGRSEPPATEPKRRSAGWVVGGVVGAAAIVGAAIFALHGHSPAAPPASPVVSAAPAAEPPPGETPLPPPATSVAAPAPAASSAIATATAGTATPPAAESSAAPSQPAPAVSALPAAAVRRMPPVDGARPAPSSRPASPSRPAAHDDDIPSLR